MIVSLTDHSTGWYDVDIALSDSDVDLLISRLNDLKSGRCDHFHFRRGDFSDGTGVSDMEIYMQDEEAKGNMLIGGK